MCDLQERWSAPRTRALAMAALGAVLPAAGCAVGSGERGAEASAAEASAEQGLQGAPLDTDHPFAVGICSTDDGACKLTSGLCTGTLVAPNLVLTARHCVDRGRQLAQDFCEQTFLGIIDPAKTYVTVSAAPFDAGAQPQWIRASKILVPQDARLCDSDIALVILASSVPAAEASPVWVDTTRDLARDLPAEVAIIGRGWLEGRLVGTPPHLEVVDHGYHRRRIVERQQVLCASDTRGTCSVEDITDPAGVFTPTIGTVLVASPGLPGDSGSGMIEQTSLDAGQPRVIAVLNLGTHDAQGQPNANGGVRLSRHREFLIAGGMEAAGAAGAAPEPWVTAEPPPIDGGGGDGGDGDGDDGGGDDGGGCAAAGAGGGGAAAAVPPLLALAGLVRRRRRH